MNRRLHVLIGSVTIAGVLTLGGVAGLADARGEPRVQSPVTPAAFGTPVRAIAGSFADVSEVVDSTNHVHVVASGRDGVWYATDRTDTWQRTRALTNSSSFSYGQATIALDANDRVHIAATRFPNGAGDVGIWYVTDKGRARGTFPAAPTKIAPQGNGEPVLKVQGGHLYLVDVKNWCCVGDGTVQLRTNVTGTWTVATVGRGQNPSFRLGTDGRARVAFQRDDFGAGIFYAIASTPSGGFSHVKLPGTGNPDTNPVLALDASNRARIAWRHFGGGSTVDFLFASQSSGGWGAASTVVSGRPPEDTMGFDIDTQGRANVADGGASIHDLRLSGGTWHSLPVVASTNVFSLVVRRAFGGHVAIAWADGGGGVWVSRN